MAPYFARGWAIPAVGMLVGLRLAGENLLVFSSLREDAKTAMIVDSRTSCRMDSAGITHRTSLEEVAPEAEATNPIQTDLGLSKRN
jgi:hypothetical protein